MKIYICAILLAASLASSAQIKTDVNAVTNIAWYIELKDMRSFVEKWTKENHGNATRTIEVVVVADGKREEMTFDELERRLTTPEHGQGQIWGCINPVNGWTQDESVSPVLRP